jgi:hypothetical protein
MERHAYFFKGARYLRYNLDTDLVDVGPDDIARFWPRLPAEFQSNLDAVLNWGDGHAYFFKGPRYLRYDVDNDLVDVAPVEISANWPKLRNDFQAGVDAAVNWGDGFAYFFKGRLYCRYNIDADVVDVGPTDIFPNWKLPEEMHSGIDAAVNWGDGHAYLFKGARYVRMNIATDLVDVGPTEISRFWTHLPAEFHSGLSDVVNWNLRLHWERRSDDERFRYVMERLVDHYGYPDTGAAGLVGNLHAESQVIPTRIEGSATATPMRAKNFQGRTTDFSATDVMNRSQRAGVGPVKPGIGLAQWTSGTRRSGLFNHPFAGDALGASCSTWRRSSTTWCTSCATRSAAWSG